MQVNKHMVIVPQQHNLDGSVVGVQVPGIPLILFPEKDPHAQVAMLAYIESLRGINPKQADEWMKMLEMLGIQIISVQKTLAEIQIKTSESL